MKGLTVEKVSSQLWKGVGFSDKPILMKAVDVHIDSIHRTSDTVTVSCSVLMRVLSGSFSDTHLDGKVKFENVKFTTRDYILLRPSFIVELNGFEGGYVFMRVAIWWGYTREMLERYNYTLLSFDIRLIRHSCDLSGKKLRTCKGKVGFIFDCSFDYWFSYEGYSITLNPKLSEGAILLRLDEYWVWVASRLFFTAESLDKKWKERERNLKWRMDKQVKELNRRQEELIEGKRR